ncbi:hypothetical protein JS510_02620 [Mycoplasma tauri]|uniref:hypothetical protein n=1 Tax=Mycoplasma tauri TaxID=547987 RepID=UPI001966EF91|nr:hypothetical protein [Mycoplasma tauri]QSB07381.1 hypothetical protein JS510_02620 [Mycoplasma tauri]
MSKPFKKSKLIKAAIVTGSVTVASIPPILVACLDNSSSDEIKRIVEEINSWNIKVNDQILTLDNNQHSVDTLEKSIEEAEKMLFDAEKAINSLDKEEYKKYSKIQNALSDTKANLDILKDKKDASKSVLENNRKKLDVIVKEATETSKKAIELAENKLEIDFEGLKAANKELEVALNEVNEAKEKAKDSAKHIDNLILLANKVKVAEDEVAKLIKEIENNIKSTNEKEDELEVEKQKAIDEIKIIVAEDDNWKKFIDLINEASSKKEIESLLLKAKGLELEAAKLKAESDIELLDFISDETKLKAIEKIKKLQDESQIAEELGNLVSKNKNKKDLFEQNIKDSDLFTPEYIEEIKQKIINEDEESKYQEIKNTFVALKEAKKQFNEKLKNNTLFDSLGTKDKENLEKKLKNIKDIAQVQELEKELDKLYKDLLSINLKWKRTRKNYKYDYLLLKVKNSKYLNTNDKLLFENKILNSKAKSKTDLMKIVSKINNKINENYQIFNDYSKVKSNFEISLKSLETYSIRHYSSLSSSHKLIIQKYRKIISSFDEKLNEYFEGKNFKSIVIEITRKKDVIGKYINLFIDVEKYINNNVPNNEVKKASWDLYIKKTEYLRHNLGLSYRKDDSVVVDFQQETIVKTLYEIERFISSKRNINNNNNNKKN